MASKNVMLPDGSEQPANDVICEDCDKPVSQHSCVTTSSSGGSGGGSGVTVSRSTGPRKDPRSRPQCPHCGGAVHFSMPGGLQNVECIMRQFYIDQGVIVDAYATLPLYGVDDLGKAVEWAKSLRTPITYGRMDSAAGGAGTYAALRPKAAAKDDKAASSGRPKKQKAAAAGEKIEDIAKEVAPVKGTSKGTGKKKPGAKAKAQPTNGKAGTVVEVTPTMESPSVVATPPVDEDAEARRARRRALLGVGR